MLSSESVVLKSQPNWLRAAQQLLQGCAALDTIDQRILLIEKIASSLGNQLYPAFIQVLCYVSHFEHSESKHQFTEALVVALKNGRLPTGNLSAWGASSFKPNSDFGSTRSLGPIEYLCVWFAQPCGREILSEVAFKNAANGLLQLFESSPSAKKTYCEKLIAEINDPLGGAFSSSLQMAMLRLLNAWKNSDDSDYAIGEFLEEHSRSLQKNLIPNTFLVNQNLL